MEVGDQAVLFGRVLRAIEAGDGLAVLVGRASLSEGTLAGVVQEALADAAESAQLDFAGGEFFEAVAFERVDGLERVDVPVVSAFVVGGRFGVVEEGDIGHVDAEFEGVSGGGLFAGVSAGSTGLQGIAAIGFDLLFGCHEKGVPFEKGWAGMAPCREMGEVSQPDRNSSRHGFLSNTGESGRCLKNQPEINFDVL
jgi:hypothetical protein